MSNYCAKHQQFYSEYCVYCGNPIQMISVSDTCSEGNCPFYPNPKHHQGWGFSPEGWVNAREKHEKHKK